MATNTLTTTAIEDIGIKTQPGYPREPLKTKGVLDTFESFDVTPVIGREFVDVSLKEWLRAPNYDDLIRDLAITSKPHSMFSQSLNTNILKSFSTRCCLLPQAG